jgi:hypothetical protein
VRVRVPDPAAAMQLLPDGVDLHSNGAYIDVSGLHSEDVIVRLVNGGVVPSEVTTRHADLEALFLQLTGEDAPQ